MAKKSIRVCSKRDDEKEKNRRRRIGGFLRLIGYKCPITDRATLRAEAERKLKEINERKRKLVVLHQEEYSSSCSEIKKLVNHVNTRKSRGGEMSREKVKSYIENVIKKGCCCSEMGFVFEKILTASDVNKAQGRLLMPFNQVRRRDVFNEIMKRENKRVDVYVYDTSSSSCYYELCLGQWDMKGNQNYALKYHWNQVVKEIRLMENMMVQLWFFQVGDDIPCLLLVPVDGGVHGGETDEDGGGSVGEAVVVHYKRR